MSKLIPDLFLLATAAFMKMKRRKTLAAHNFSGRNVLVTGGARGFGKAAVEKFIQAEAQVYVVDEDRAAIAQLLEEHPTVTAAKVDLRNMKAAMAIVNQFGPIHHLVNNANIGYFYTNIEDVGPEQEKHVMRFLNMNFSSVIYASLPMAQGNFDDDIRGATIVNIVSETPNMPAITVGRDNVTRLGVVAVSESLAKFVKQFGVRLNTVSPTIIHTDYVTDDIKFLTYQRHIFERLTPEEAASLVLLLSSPRSTFFSGQTVFIDGNLLRNQ